MSDGGIPLGVTVVTLLVCCALGYPMFLLGGQGAREEESITLARARAARATVIAAATSEERQATAKLRSEIASLKKQIAPADPATIKRLRRDVERLHKRVTPTDSLVLDESLNFMALLERMCRKAVGEELAGASLELVKGRRAFILQLGFPAQPSEPEALAKLARSLSALPDQVEGQWVTHLGLKTPEVPPLYLPITKLGAETWQVLLGAFQSPHRRLPDSMPRRNSSLYRTSAISVSHSLKVETTLELYGPKRVSATLRPGNSLYEQLPAGTYVLVTRAEGQLPHLGVFRLRGGHMTKPHLSSKP